MRRAILAVTGMVAGTTLLISLKSAPGASRLPAQVAADEAAAARAAALAAAAAGPSGQPSPGPGGVGPSAPAGGGQPPAAPAGQSQGQSGQPPAGQAQPGQQPTARPPAGGSSAPNPRPPAAGSFTGDSSYTEFGYVTVAITVSGGKITDVKAVELPSNEPRSVSISAKAGPTLRQRALAAQSSTIDSVSGATYTSDAYKSSLQSALDKAGLGKADSDNAAGRGSDGHERQPRPR